MFWIVWGCVYSSDCDIPSKVAKLWSDELYRKKSMVEAQVIGAPLAASDEDHDR